MTNKELRYFELAKNTCQYSDFPKIKIGCVCVYKNKILSIGYNSTKSHPLQEYYNQFRNLEIRNNGNFINPSLHAEIHCLSQIRDLDIDFGKIELFIYRVCKDREMGLVRPCAGCMKMIKDLGIKKIYYTTDDGLCKEYII